MSTKNSIQSEVAAHSAAIADLRAKVEALRTILEASGRAEILLSAPHAAAPDSALYRLNHLSPATQNLYPMETNEEGIDFRWTGPGSRVEMHFPLVRRTETKASILVCAAISPQTLSDTRVFVDGQEAPSTIDGDNVVFNVPASATSGDKVSIGLQTGSVLRPNDLDANSTDERLLGIALRTVEFSK